MRKNDEFIDFVNTIGKNIGEIQNTKLAKFFDINEGSIRRMKKEDPFKLDCLYLGALCKANNITKEDIIETSKNKMNEGRIKEVCSALNLTYAQFGEKIGYTEYEIKTAVLNNNVSIQMHKAIELYLKTINREDLISLLIEYRIK